MNHVEIQSPIQFKTDEKAKAFGPELVISVSVSHLLITINASANFAIYCAKVQTYNLTHAYCKSQIKLNETQKKNKFGNLTIINASAFCKLRNILC